MYHNNGRAIKNTIDIIVNRLVGIGLKGYEIRNGEISDDRRKAEIS